MNKHGSEGAEGEASTKGRRDRGGEQTSTVAVKEKKDRDDASVCVCVCMFVESAGRLGWVQSSRAWRRRRRRRRRRSLHLVPLDINKTSTHTRRSRSVTSVPGPGRGSVLTEIFQAAAALTAAAHFVRRRSSRRRRRGRSRWHRGDEGVREGDLSRTGSEERVRRVRVRVRVRVRRSRERRARRPRCRGRSSRQTRPLGAAVRQQLAHVREVDAVEAVLHREAQVDEGVREVRHEQVGERWLR